MSDMKEQLAKQLQEAQAKYTYFLLATAASGIALAVQRTTGQTLGWDHLLLGLAVVLWGASFFAGCRNRAYFSSTLYANVALLQLQDGSHPEAPTHPQAVGAACEGVRTAAASNSASGNTWGKWQFRLLIAGALFFLAWHIVCMAKSTPKAKETNPNNAMHTDQKSAPLRSADSGG